MSKSTRRSRRRPRGGFSLIEVAVAMGLLAAAAVGSIAGMTAMMRQNRENRLRGQAATIARDTMDRLIGVTSAAISGAQFDLAVSSAGYPKGATTTDTVGFIERKVTVGVQDGAGMVNVRIQLGWPRMTGDVGRQSFDLQLARPN